MSTRTSFTARLNSTKQITPRARFDSLSPQSVSAYGPLFVNQGASRVTHNASNQLEIHRSGSGAITGCFVRYSITGATKQTISGAVQWNGGERFRIDAGVQDLDSFIIGNNGASGGIGQEDNRYTEVKGPGTQSTRGPGLHVSHGILGEAAGFLTILPDRVWVQEGDILALESEEQIVSETIYADDDSSGSLDPIVIDANGRIMRDSSSREGKTDIEDVDPAYSMKLLHAQPRWFRSKKPKRNPQWSHWGFIAEEIAEIDPRLVSWGYTKDDYEPCQLLDKDGNPKVRKIKGVRGTGEFDPETGEEIEVEYVIRTVPVMGKRLKEGAKLKARGVAYSRVPVHLLVIAQQQQATIEKLVERVAALEAAKAKG